MHLLSYHLSRFTPKLTFCQVLPSGHRGTGNGVAIGLNRIMGIISAVVGDAANVSIEVARLSDQMILILHPD